MGRLWVCLPLCLLMQDERPLLPDGETETQPPPPARRELVEACRDLGGVLAIAPTPFPGTLPWASLCQASEHSLSRPRRLSRDVAAGLAALASPAAPSWTLLGATVVDKGPEILEETCYGRPTRFLQMCLDRYKREVQGYSCTLVKQERINGKLRPLEVTEIHFREKPFSVFMKWTKGSSPASPVLFVAGENKGKLLARAVLIWEKDVDGPEAKNTSRYLVSDFGMYIGARRSLSDMLKAQKSGTLSVAYYGTEKVARLDDRVCHKFVRVPCDPADKDGVWEDAIHELTIYIDAETWLQTGSILRDAKGELIGEYFFRNIQLNPTFSPKQFTRGAL